MENYFSKNVTKESLMNQIVILTKNIDRMFEEKDKIQEMLNKMEVEEILQNAILQSKYYIK